ncbi:hypothetical protein FisN_25Hh226 [Fistulifera solaris]|uniref:Amine oxidase domain-containing protein n=1 Tax=Fistulifera solaris TaxID=1519565 RepID=A0A1Z5K6W1_FISSO|nr:hypothetical protein FisN_25Hh226 [Fistulifera solaris]|eukprot:GAX21974.1 hypothetical protein FisN_25Hh226 [Fistulifera solaris]
MRYALLLTVRLTAIAAFTATPCFRPSTISNSRAMASQPNDSYDVVVVGSGIGGLCCAAMLALYGSKVAVFESHTHPGGAAHGFSIEKDGLKFQFDTGPSFFSGLNPDSPPKSSNPLRTVLDAIDERVECIPYTSFGLMFPEGEFVHTPEFDRNVLSQFGNAQAEWKSLMKLMEPLAATVAALPTAALRADIGVIKSAAPFLPKLILNPQPWNNLLLTQPYSEVLKQAGVKNTFLKNWIDLLCFCLSGLPASGTISAEMAMMMGEFYEPDAIMDCPRSGATSIVDALVRGLEKNGGDIFCRSHVDKIEVDERGQAVGVVLRKNGQRIRAKKAVVSNMSIWDLLKSGVVDRKHFPASFLEEREDTPVGKSFMHLHVGFKASREELAKLQAHYMFMKDWSLGVEAADNAVLLSIPSVHDESLAPPGFGVLHAYLPATEDFATWEGLDRKSIEYQQLKESRSAYLWSSIEKVIPDIRERVVVSRVGTPLTHQRFLRRYKGSYGPAIKAGEASFPFPGTPVKGLLLCGDSCFPGIGVPAVAGSGLLAANSVSLDSLEAQTDVLRKLRLREASSSFIRKQ